MVGLREQEGAEVAGTHSDARGMDLLPLPSPEPSFGPLPSQLECEALAAGFPSREAIAALRAAGVPDTAIRDFSPTEASARFFARRRWDYDPAGAPVLLLMARDTFGDVIDVIAWPIARPEKWARISGRATILGEEHLACRLIDDPVPVFRTPLAWLASGGRGIVILDPVYAWRRLREGPPLSGEDLAHARDIRAALAPPEPPKVFVRSTTARRAAA
ncbi:hypothetical protein [Xanthobacter sp. KR7-225]|uniref:hypothetical protein n=1 Tax=Xanthobacter sp. KR7-225 TaxID=3156613 RepID=UPI0032B5989A